MSPPSLPTYDQLLQPLPPWHPKAWYYGGFRLLLGTLGRLSDGICVGLDFGFDSGVMLEYVYRNRPAGQFCLGKAIDRAFLNSQGWRGIRERGQILQRLLQQMIQANQAQGIQTRLLDVACGGGRYDLEVLQDFSPETVIATLRDYKSENVQKARQLAEKLKVSATIETADAFSDADLNRVTPPPNLIVVSGLHEILPDNELIRHHFVQLAQILEPGGTLLFTIQPYHPQLELIARTLNAHTGKPWVMRLRSLDLTTAWAQAAGFSILQVEMDSVGIFGVVAAKR